MASPWLVFLDVKTARGRFLVFILLPRLPSPTLFFCKLFGQSAFFPQASERLQETRWTGEGAGPPVCLLAATLKASLLLVFRILLLHFPVFSVPEKVNKQAYSPLLVTSFPPHTLALPLAKGNQHHHEHAPAPKPTTLPSSLHLPTLSCSHCPTHLKAFALHSTETN